MKKAVNVSGGKAEGLELNKKLTKNVSECVRKVDGVTSIAKSSGSVFNPQAIAARMRLREACERTILNGHSSSQSSQCVEEVLWKKGFYEPFCQAKKMRKGMYWSQSESGVIWTHLNDGIAFYQHLLISIGSNLKQTDFCADFLSSPFGDDGLTKSIMSSLCKETFFRCLTYLGDLARYLLDIPIQVFGSNSCILPIRYYHQALHYNPEGGLTHSNLATVYSTNDQPLLATLHYMRAITCEKPFEAAEGNLRRMLEKSKIWLENEKMKGKKDDVQLERDSQNFLHTCLALVSCLITNKRTEDVAVLCQDVLVQLGKLLDSYDDSEPADLSEGSSEAGNGANVKDLKAEFGSLFILNPESMVTLCAVFIICSKRLKSQGSSHSSMSEVLLVSILLTLVSHINTRLEQRFSLVDPYFIQKLLPVPEVETKPELAEVNQETDVKNCNGNAKEDKKGKNKLAKLRRKKIKRSDDSGQGMNGCDDSDCSLDGSSDDDNLSLSDNEDEFDSSALYSSEEYSDEDVKIESDQEWQGLTAREHLELIGQEGMMAAVYVIFEWLSINEEIIKMCSKTAQSLWSSLAKFFNLLKVDYNQLMEDKPDVKDEWLDLLKGPTSKILSVKIEGMIHPDSSSNLPEDLMLHLVLPSFISVTSRGLTAVEINIERIHRLNFLMSLLVNRKDTPVHIEKDKFIFNKDEMKQDSNKSEDKEINTPAIRTPSPTTPRAVTVSPSLNRVTSGMQALTAQWLQHEVRNLEERTQRRIPLGGLYLVPDAIVLTRHLAAMKKMLASPTHMVIIPQIVIDSLDQQKKESSGAREAIRWLENKLRHGSRFIRVQRQHEKSRLPLIKYPKKKDKEAWEWFQLAECCCYLGAQMHNLTHIKTSTVTLLTGESNIKISKFSFSLHTLAEAAGGVLQNVEEFVRKWQTSTKGHS